MDILDSAAQNGAFGLFTCTVRDDPSEFVDTFVDVTSTSTLNFFLWKYSALVQVAGMNGIDERDCPFAV